ncbi:AMH_1a_G0056770.mRNA.1.CDS.1 [Saccharomyces cerevisiae]|nr:AMH_1a_G0056770.mRNA.1.CDS.1 [Saccharomyces cerevisiae]CAI6915813.1 AMH_1a_G0056770.mRNA.1.CDS.1 [Saccharomyces cerevisiae]
MVTSHRLVENIHRFDLPIHSFISSFFLGQYLYPLLQYFLIDVLYRNNSLILFFQCHGCQEAFRTTLLEPFSLKKDEAAKIKSFKYSVLYIEEALESLFNTEKSWSPVGLEDAKLPKDAYRFKLTWILKRIFNIFMLIPFLNFLFCIYVSWGMCLLLRTLYLGWIFFMLVQGFQNIRVLIMSMEQKMQFLSTIINEQESGANGWEEIAKKMNRYLFEKKVWKNEEFFFDGIDYE